MASGDPNRCGSRCVRYSVARASAASIARDTGVTAEAGIAEDGVPARTVEGASARRDLLVLAPGEDLVLARLEQRVDRLLLSLPQRFGQRLAQRDHHRRLVAMRAARRLVDDLVYKPELFQP